MIWMTIKSRIIWKNFKRKHRIRLHKGRAQRADRQQPSHAPINSTADKLLDASTNASIEIPDKALEARICHTVTQHRPMVKCPLLYQQQGGVFPSSMLFPFIYTDSRCKTLFFSDRVWTKSPSADIFCH